MCIRDRGTAGSHKLQGIGAGFIPEVLDTKIYDEIIPVTSGAAFETGRQIARQEGVLVGISSGAAAWAAIELAKRPENKGKTIVALLPDTGAVSYTHLDVYKRQVKRLIVHPQRVSAPVQGFVFLLFQQALLLKQV